MGLKGAFLRTRVARRVLALFALCALVPIGALALFSYVYVSNQLETQSRNRLRQASKLASDGLLERLFFLETGLNAVSLTLGEGSSELNQSLEGRVRSLMVQAPAGAQPDRRGRDRMGQRERHGALGRRAIRASAERKGK